LRLLLGLVFVFTLFQWTAAGLGSNRGEAGLAVGAIVVAATVLVERLGFGGRLAGIPKAVGLGRPLVPGLAAAAVASLLVLLVLPVYMRITGASAAPHPGGASLLLGLFVQAGIAEELLFRGYLFGHLRRGRPFWRAGWLSTVPFVAVHLWLFFTMAWPIAAAAVLLSVIMSFPLAQLFELGGRTIWAPAWLHFVVQAVPKLVVVSDDAPVPFPLIWMGAAALLPMVTFLFPRPGERRLPG